MTAEVPEVPLRTIVHKSASLDETLEFLKEAEFEMRALRKVRVWPDRLRVYDVNGDCVEILGLGYTQEEIMSVLDAVHTAYRRDSISEPTDKPYKEFKTGRRYPWAHDRVM